MTIFTATPSLPDPLSIDAAVLVAATLRPDFKYTELSDDIPTIEGAVNRLADRHHWPIGWMRCAPGYIAMRAFKDCTAELTRAWALNLMQGERFIEKVLAGPREKLAVIADAAINAAHKKDAAQRKAKEIYASGESLTDLRRSKPIEVAQGDVQ